ncbi:MAG TPA: hypothetical protein VGI66_01255 [Streptosporangiaceae bacterium]
MTGFEKGARGARELKDAPAPQKVSAAMPGGRYFSHLVMKWITRTTERWRSQTRRAEQPHLYVVDGLAGQRRPAL